jgi:hypothetical protein
LDFVAVSGANEYTVKPLALVSTLVPPIVAVFGAVLAAAAGEAAAADELLGVLAVPLLPDGDEVPHAAAIRATPARPAGALSAFADHLRVRRADAGHAGQGMFDWKLVDR